MEGQSFFLLQLTMLTIAIHDERSEVMALSISQLAKEHQAFVLTKLKEAEQGLHPSSTEDEELVRRAVFSVRNKSIVLNDLMEQVLYYMQVFKMSDPLLLKLIFQRKSYIVAVLKQNGVDIK